MHVFLCFYLVMSSASSNDHGGNQERPVLPQGNDDDNDNNAARGAGVQRCVAFLKHPEVVHIPIQEKTKFLRQQGFSDSQILEALQTANSHKDNLTTTKAKPQDSRPGSRTVPEEFTAGKSSSTSWFPAIAAVGASIFGYHYASQRGSVRSIGTAERAIHSKSFLEDLKEWGSFYVDEVAKALLGEDMPSHNQHRATTASEAPRTETQSCSSQAAATPKSAAFSSTEDASRSTFHSNHRRQDTMEHLESRDGLRARHSLQPYRNIPSKAGDSSFWIEQDVKELKRDVHVLRRDLEDCTKLVKELKSREDTAVPVNRARSPRSSAEVVYEYESSSGDALESSQQANGVSSNVEKNIESFSPEALEEKISRLSAFAATALSRCVEANVNGDFAQKSGTLMVLFSNLARDPENPQYHKIRLSSSSSLRNIVSIKNYSMLLRSAGFVPAPLSEEEKLSMEYFQNKFEPKDVEDIEGDDNTTEWEWSWATVESEVARVCEQIGTDDAPKCRPHNVVKHLTEGIRRAVKETKAKQSKPKQQPTEQCDNGVPVTPSPNKGGPKFPLSFEEVIDCVRSGNTPSDVEQVPETLSSRAEQYSTREEILARAEDAPEKPYSRDEEDK
eukprot:gb/GECG01013182.1/.p1 GENE.gb/GECG01013182.1/~~gb/GECG01013182.1/.p1  ORF type:complete len:616 (+),score=90.24 gb/GECG01013182.1/:1-1848(+)